jgi:transposase
MRLTGWVAQSTMFASTNKERFVDWLRRNLLPKLRRGDVIVLDNLTAHHDARVEPLCNAAGVRVLYLCRLSLPLTPPFPQALTPGVTHPA